MKSGTRSQKSGGIGRIFGFLCCRGGSVAEDDARPARPASTKRDSEVSRKVAPLGKEHIKSPQKDGGDSGLGASKEAVDLSKAPESSAKPDIVDAKAVPVVTTPSHAPEKDEAMAKAADNALIGTGIVVSESKAGEAGSATQSVPVTPAPLGNTPARTDPSQAKSDLSTFVPPEPPLPPPPQPEDAPMVEAPEAPEDETDDGRGRRIDDAVQIALPPQSPAEKGDTESAGGDEGEDEGQSHDGAFVQEPLGKERQQWLLPPLRPEFENKKCLVLDLDETLVHSSFKVGGLLWACDVANPL